MNAALSIANATMVQLASNTLKQLHTSFLSKEKDMF
jgi:hypothetical protein